MASKVAQVARISNLVTDAVACPSPAQPGRAKPYKLILKEIHDGLRSDDLHSLKFLCGGTNLIPAGKMEQIRTSLQLFEELENMQLIGPPDDLRFLAEILFHVRCNKCLKSLNMTSSDVAAHIGIHSLLVDKYRLMLFKVSEGLTSRNVEEIKYICNPDYLSRSALEGIKNSLDLILALEKGGHIGAQDLDFLIKRLEDTKRKDLVKRVLAYQNNNDGSGDTSARISNIHIADPSSKSDIKDQQRLAAEACHERQTAPQATESVAGHNSQQNNYISYRPAAPTNPGQSLVDGQCAQLITERPATTDKPPFVPRVTTRLVGGPGDRTVTVNEESPPLQMVVGPGSGQNAVDLYPLVECSGANQVSTLQSYTMTQKPRGICVIINNEMFKNSARSNARLDDRTGTEVDEGLLRELFETALHFRVIVFNNLSAKMMSDKLFDVAQLDHSQYDCFACVILSHGMLGTVYGVDGLKVEIVTLMSYFKRDKCRTLKGKPKLFFLQACQGKKKAEDVVADSPGDELESIPSERDFLLSYSTVPGYVSYRSRTKGSWYIGSLVKKIRELHHREDLLSILIAVNDDVSEKTAKEIYRQSPAPICTITKKIYFR